MSKQTEQREANLKRWAEVAPGECVVWTDQPRMVQVQIVGRSWILSMRPEHQPLLLSALIEAIRARGWHYKLESQENLSGRYEQATVYRDPGQYVLADGDDARALESCDALLSAYVRALEATKESE